MQAMNHGAQVPLPQTKDDYPKKILVMGLTGAGKSTFINSVARSNLPVGSNIHSCTQTSSHVSLHLDGTLVELMDTPGFDDSVRSEFEILQDIVPQLEKWARRGLHAIIYIHRISDYRVSGSALRAFEVFLKMCGATDTVAARVAIVTNMWEVVPSKLGEEREAELMNNDALPFKRAIDLGAKMHRNDNPPQTTLAIVRDLVGDKTSSFEPVHLHVQRELAGGIKLLQTAAGDAISYELARKRAEHEAEMKSLSLQYEKARQEHDTETLKEIEEERNLMKKQLEELKSTEAYVRKQLKQKASYPQISHDPNSERVNYGTGCAPSPEAGSSPADLILILKLMWPWKKSKKATT